MAQSREFRRALRAAFVAFVTTVLCSAPAAAQIVPMLQPFERSFDPAIFLTEGQSFTVDLEQLRAVPATGETLIAAFPLTREESVDLVMHRIDPLKADTRLVAVDRFGREIPVARSETHFLGGSVLGLTDSSAFIAVTEAGVFGWVQTSEAKFIISSGPTTDAHAPAVFNTASASFGAIAWVPFSCGALQAPGVAQNEFAVDGVQSMLATCRTVDVALDTDQEYLAAFGGNQAAALGYLQTLVAGSDEIYRRDLSVQLRLSYARLWTTADPWTGTDSLVQLEQFRTYWLAQMGSVGRDVAHLISPRNLGGGIAWGDALCSSFSYGVCGNMTGFFPTPMVNNSVQNWDIVVFPHELGHNCGAIHTHEYCPPVDQCAPAGYFGACQTAQVCISSGTLMSYCGLCAGGEANTVLAFHPTSAAEISGFMSTAACAPVVNCSSNPACVLSISSASAIIPPLGGSASITVSTIAPGCAWTPVTVPSWITVTNPGPASGSGTFAYTVSANATLSDRTATLQIGDLTHTVTQLSSVDCDGNGLGDASEITANPALDCNSDGVLNSCEITEGAADCDGNGVPDSCQVTTTVRAWGAGSPGTTGGSNYGQSTIPANLGTTKFIAAGAYHSLAVRLDGTVIGWGLNTSGQVTIPASLPKVKAVAGGGSHSVALVLDGSIVCWGLNTDGQCNVPSALGAAMAVAAGTSHTVALRSGGTVACWGANTSGQSTVPAGLSGITSISAGALNTLALGITGTITGWGQNVYGQSTPPTGLAGVTMIASGAAHSVALRGDGTMACWGNNSFAQCTVPTDIGVVQKVFAGGYVTIALRVDGSVRMWGRNESGQSTLPAGLANDRMLAAGTAHTLTLEAASTLADCDQDGTPDGCELQGGSADCDRNGVPDSCDIAAGAADANGNGVLDLCEIASGSSAQWRVQDGGNGHWYSRIDLPLTWEAAESAAEARGGTLVTITSQAEGAFLRNSVAPAMHFWAGGRRVGGAWQWVTGEPWSYTAWNCNHCQTTCEPDGPTEDWLEAMCWDGSSIRWNNYTSSSGRPSYVIEWSADCNSDGIVDYGQILAGQLPDLNTNGIPDGCENAGFPCPDGNAAVVNDCVRNAQIVLADATIAFTNVGCNTDGPTHPAATCVSGNDVFLNDIWYRVQATANGPMRISTCNQVNFDTKLAVYDMGTDPLSFDYGALASAFVACNDDGDAACQANAVYASDLSLTVNAGRWYLIRVAAYDFPGSGSVSINLPEPCTLPPFTGVEAEACGANTNGGCNGAGTQAITAGSRIKGTLWESAGSRDVDYYSITVTGELEVTARVYAASLVTCQILGGDIGVPNCGGLSVLKNGSGNCPTEAATCLRTGTYYIAVSTSTGGGYPCGSGLLNEYVLEVVTAPAYCPVETNGACNAPGPNTATINSSNTALNGLVRCATQPAFPACRSGGSSANSYARSFPVGAIAGAISCINFGVWSVIRDTNAAGNACGLFLSDRPLPATVGVYRDLDGGDPRNKIVAAGDGNDLELIEARQVLIPGVAAVQTLNFEPPICVDSAASSNLVIILDFPNLRDGSTGIPADAGYQLLAGGNLADAGSATFIRLDCADSALRYVIAETLGATFTARWYVAVNGDWSTCAGIADCNGDGVSDLAQIRAGQLADFDSDLIPDCCEQGTACTIGHYPVQWRTADGGNGHWYAMLTATPARSPEEHFTLAQAMGGHTATVRSLAENAFAFGVGGQPSTLIGVRKQSNVGTWITGEPWDFTYWYGSEGQNSGELYAVQNSSWGGEWQDLDATPKTHSLVEWDADCNSDGIVDYGQILLGQLVDADSNGVPDTCEVDPADCNGDGVNDVTQCRSGTLADFNSNDIPDCCEQGTTCVVGNYPVQWRSAAGGNGHWYELGRSGDALAWSTAQSNCAGRGGHLATILSEAEDVFAFSLTMPQTWQGPLGPWLGGQQVPGSGEPLGIWTWVTGEPWNYVGPDETFPNNGGPPGTDENRLHYIDFMRRWNDIPADGNGGIKTYLVEWSADCNGDGIVDYGQILRGQLADTDADGVPNDCEVDPGDCNADGVLDADQIRAGQLADFNSNLIPDCCERGEACVLGNYAVQWRVEDGGDGTWYKVDSTTRTAVNSRDAALSAGGHLAIIRSSNENAVIQRLVATHAASTSAWLGGYQDFASASYSEPAGGWRWLDGTPIAGYSNWDAGTGAPNNAGGFQEDWVEMLPTGTWNDARRALTRSMVVEWEDDCNNDGIVDYGQILLGQLADTDGSGVPDSCERPADIDGDGSVGGSDLALLLGNWGGTGTGDINGDGAVNGGDLAMLLGDWG